MAEITRNVHQRPMHQALDQHQAQSRSRAREEVPRGRLTREQLIKALGKEFRDTDLISDEDFLDTLVLRANEQGLSIELLGAAVHDLRQQIQLQGDTEASAIQEERLQAAGQTAAEARQALREKKIKVAVRVGTRALYSFAVAAWKEAAQDIGLGVATDVRRQKTRVREETAYMKQALESALDRSIKKQRLAQFMELGGEDLQKVVNSFQEGNITAIQLMQLPEFTRGVERILGAAQLEGDSYDLGPPQGVINFADYNTKEVPEIKNAIRGHWRFLLRDQIIALATEAGQEIITADSYQPNLPGAKSTIKQVGRRAALSGTLWTVGLRTGGKIAIGGYYGASILTGPAGWGVAFGLGVVTGATRALINGEKRRQRKRINASVGRQEYNVEVDGAEHKVVETATEIEIRLEEAINQLQQAEAEAREAWREWQRNVHEQNLRIETNKRQSWNDDENTNPNEQAYKHAVEVQQVRVLIVYNILSDAHSRLRKSRMAEKKFIGGKKNRQDYISFGYQDRAQAISEFVEKLQAGMTHVTGYMDRLEAETKENLVRNMEILDSRQQNILDRIEAKFKKQLSVGETKQVIKGALLGGSVAGVVSFSMDALSFVGGTVKDAVFGDGRLAQIPSWPEGQTAMTVPLADDMQAVLSAEDNTIEIIATQPESMMGNISLAVPDEVDIHNISFEAMPDGNKITVIDGATGNVVDHINITEHVVTASHEIVRDAVLPVNLTPDAPVAFSFDSLDYAVNIQRDSGIIELWKVTSDGTTRIFETAQSIYPDGAAEAGVNLEELAQLHLEVSPEGAVVIQSALDKSEVVKFTLGEDVDPTSGATAAVDAAVTEGAAPVGDAAEIIKTVFENPTVAEVMKGFGVATDDVSFDGDHFHIDPAGNDYLTSAGGWRQTRLELFFDATAKGLVNSDESSIEVLSRLEQATSDVLFETGPKMNKDAALTHAFGMAVKELREGVMKYVTGEAGAGHSGISKPWADIAEQAKSISRLQAIEPGDAAAPSAAPLSSDVTALDRPLAEAVGRKAWGAAIVDMIMPSAHAETLPDGTRISDIAVNPLDVTAVLEPVEEAAGSAGLETPASLANAIIDTIAEEALTPYNLRRLQTIEIPQLDEYTELPEHDDVEYYGTHVSELPFQDPVAEAEAMMLNRRVDKFETRHVRRLERAIGLTNDNFGRDITPTSVTTRMRAREAKVVETYNLAMNELSDLYTGPADVISEVVLPGLRMTLDERMAEMYRQVDRMAVEFGYRLADRTNIFCGKIIADINIIEQGITNYFNDAFDDKATQAAWLAEQLQDYNTRIRPLIDDDLVADITLLTSASNLNPSRDLRDISEYVDAVARRGSRFVRSAQQKISDLEANAALPAPARAAATAASAPADRRAAPPWDRPVAPAFSSGPSPFDDDDLLSPSSPPAVGSPDASEPFSLETQAQLESNERDLETIFEEVFDKTTQGVFIYYLNDQQLTIDERIAALKRGIRAGRELAGRLSGDSGITGSYLALVAGFLNSDGSYNYNDINIFAANCITAESNPLAEQGNHLEAIKKLRVFIDMIFGSDFRLMLFNDIYGQGLRNEQYLAAVSRFINWWLRDVVSAGLKSEAGESLEGYLPSYLLRELGLTTTDGVLNEAAVSEIADRCVNGRTPVYEIPARSVEAGRNSKPLASIFDSDPFDKPDSDDAAPAFDELEWPSLPESTDPGTTKSIFDPWDEAASDPFEIDKSASSSEVSGGSEDIDDAAPPVADAAPPVEPAIHAPVVGDGTGVPLELPDADEPSFIETQEQLESRERDLETIFEEVFDWITKDDFSMYLKRSMNRSVVYRIAALKRGIRAGRELAGRLSGDVGVTGPHLALVAGFLNTYGLYDHEAIFSFAENCVTAESNPLAEQVNHKEAIYKLRVFIGTRFGFDFQQRLFDDISDKGLRNEQYLAAVARFINWWQRDVDIAGLKSEAGELLITHERPRLLRELGLTTDGVFDVAAVSEIADRCVDGRTPVYEIPARSIQADRGSDPLAPLSPLAPPVADTAPLAEPITPTSVEGDGTGVPLELSDAGEPQESNKQIAEREYTAFLAEFDGPDGALSKLRTLREAITAEHLVTTDQTAEQHVAARARALDLKQAYNTVSDRLNYFSRLPAGARKYKIAGDTIGTRVARSWIVLKGDVGDDAKIGELGAIHKAIQAWAAARIDQFGRELNTTLSDKNMPVSVRLKKLTDQQGALYTMNQRLEDDIALVREAPAARGSDIDELIQFRAVQVDIASANYNVAERWDRLMSAVHSAFDGRAREGGAFLEAFASAVAGLAPAEQVRVYETLLDNKTRDQRASEALSDLGIIDEAGALQADKVKTFADEALRVKSQEELAQQELMNRVYGRFGSYMRRHLIRALRARDVTDQTVLTTTLLEAVGDDFTAARDAKRAEFAGPPRNMSGRKLDDAMKDRKTLNDIRSTVLRARLLETPDGRPHEPNIDMVIERLLVGETGEAVLAGLSDADPAVEAARLERLSEDLFQRYGPRLRDNFFDAVRERSFAEQAALAEVLLAASQERFDALVSENAGNQRAARMALTFELNLTTDRDTPINANLATVAERVLAGLTGTEIFADLPPEARGNGSAASGATESVRTVEDLEKSRDNRLHIVRVRLGAAMQSEVRTAIAGEDPQRQVDLVSVLLDATKERFERLIGEQTGNKKVQERAAQKSLARELVITDDRGRLLQGNITEIARRLVAGTTGAELFNDLSVQSGRDPREVKQEIRQELIDTRRRLAASLDAMYGHDMVEAVRQAIIAMDIGQQISLLATLEAAATEKYATILANNGNNASAARLELGRELVIRTQRDNIIRDNVVEVVRRLLAGQTGQALFEGLRPGGGKEERQSVNPENRLQRMGEAVKGRFGNAMFEMVGDAITGLPIERSIELVGNLLNAVEEQFQHLLESYESNWTQARDILTQDLRLTNTNNKPIRSNLAIVVERIMADITGPALFQGLEFPTRGEGNGGSNGSPSGDSRGDRATRPDRPPRREAAPATSVEPVRKLTDYTVVGGSMQYVFADKQRTPQHAYRLCARIADESVLSNLSQAVRYGGEELWQACGRLDTALAYYPETGPALVARLGLDQANNIAALATALRNKGTSPNALQGLLRGMEISPAQAGKEPPEPPESPDQPSTSAPQPSSSPTSSEDAASAGSSDPIASETEVPAAKDFPQDEEPSGEELTAEDLAAARPGHLAEFQRLFGKPSRERLERTLARFEDPENEGSPMMVADAILDGAMEYLSEDAQRVPDWSAYTTQAARREALGLDAGGHVDMAALATYLIQAADDVGVDIRLSLDSESESDSQAGPDASSEAGAADGAPTATPDTSLGESTGLDPDLVDGMKLEAMDQLERPRHRLRSAFENIGDFVRVVARIQDIIESAGNFPYKRSEVDRVETSLRSIRRIAGRYESEVESFFPILEQTIEHQGFSDAALALSRNLVDAVEELTRASATIMEEYTQQWMRLANTIEEYENRHRGTAVGSELKTEFRRGLDVIRPLNDGLKMAQRELEELQTTIRSSRQASSPPDEVSKEPPTPRPSVTAAPRSAEARSSAASEPVPAELPPLRPAPEKAAPMEAASVETAPMEAAPVTIEAVPDWNPPPGTDIETYLKTLPGAAELGMKILGAASMGAKIYLTGQVGTLKKLGPALIGLKDSMLAHKGTYLGERKRIGTSLDDRFTAVAEREHAMVATVKGMLDNIKPHVSSKDKAKELINETLPTFIETGRGIVKGYEEIANEAKAVK